MILVPFLHTFANETLAEDRTVTAWIEQCSWSTRDASTALYYYNKRDVKVKRNNAPKKEAKGKMITEKGKKGHKREREREKERVSFAASKQEREAPRMKEKKGIMCVVGNA